MRKLTPIILILAVALAVYCKSAHGGTFTLPPMTACSGITVSGTTATATVSSTSGITNGDKVLFYGSSVNNDNGVKTVNVASSTTLTFTTTQTGSRTGTILYADINTTTPIFNAFLATSKPDLISDYSVQNIDTSTSEIFYVDGLNGLDPVALPPGSAVTLHFTTGGKSAIGYVFGLAASTSATPSASGGVVSKDN